MKKELETTLDQILEDHADDNAAIAEAEHAKAARAALAEVRYGELRDNIILPAMLEVGNKAQQRGIEFQIAMDDVDKLRTSIRFFLPTNAAGLESRPSLTVVYAPPYENITFFENDPSAGGASTSGGAVGPTGELPLHKVTLEQIQKRLLDLLDRAR